MPDKRRQPAATHLFDHAAIPLDKLSDIAKHGREP
jgi:hypothetical protein